MKDNIIQNSDGLKVIYNKLNEMIEQLNRIVLSNEEDDNELKSVWNTEKSWVYFSDSNSLNEDIKRLIREYEKLKDEIRIKMYFHNMTDNEVEIL